MAASAKTLSDAYQKDGFLSSVDILTEAEARDHRRRLEAAEAETGPLHYRAKIFTMLTSPVELATDPRVLDVVEALIGPDILLFDACYIIKEPGSEGFVSWHQDLTYWGFDGDDQVSMWLALSPANELSGCMRMIAGSHKGGRIEHRTEDGDANVLALGQRIDGIEQDDGELQPLDPGQASFHHGWTLHGSMPNRSDDRRIGLNVQYIKPSMRQVVNPHETALLVRGEDRYGYYGADVPADADLDPAAIKRNAELDRIRKETWANA